MEKLEFNCKELGCKNKVKCVLGSAVSVLKLQGVPETPEIPATIPVRLTCKKGHTNTYDIKKTDLPINEKFWIDKAGEMVNGSAANVGTSAEKLNDLLKWLWPIYTAGTATAGIGIALAKLSLPIPIVILVALTGVSLIVAYALVSMADSVTLMTFDPNSPRDVLTHYQELIETKYKRFRWSLLFTILAVVLVIGALVSTSFLKQAAAPGFKAYLHSQDVAITGQGPANTNLLIKIIGANVRQEVPYVTPASGKIETRINLSASPNAVDVLIQWTDRDKAVHVLEGTVTQ